ncbi:hypothetical protein QVD17_35947 [Tagetes erecta]|uniref:Uncharacterized protein n=1 Tax=Tagetes erecta TaxID=13708 RepID=A0AAD8JVD4_TARER|nr:hypothetical protein QVD17_35947 [Tagetes erecta]
MRNGCTWHAIIVWCKLPAFIVANVEDLLKLSSSWSLQSETKTIGRIPIMSTTYKLLMHNVLIRYSIHSISVERASKVMQVGFSIDVRLLVFNNLQEGAGKDHSFM